MSTPNHYLITGGCGFIGTSLITRLRGENPKAKIRILDNLSVGTKDDLAEVCNFAELSTSHFYSQHSSNTENPSDYPEVELIIGDIKDYNTCSKCCRDINCIVHLAANTGVGPSVEKPRIDMETNVIGTFNMLEAARQNNIGKFIFASSGAPIGEVDPPIHEEKAPKPVSPYGASKLAGEGYCSAYYRTFGLKTISLRFGNVYGPLSKHKNSVVAKFIKQALKGETLEIYGDGKQTRDFIYIDDLLEAIILASRAEIGGEVFQIATYKETTVNEIAKVVKEFVEMETGKKVNIIYGNFRPGDVKRNFSDITKAKKILGFVPRYDLMTGLKKTFESFVRNTQQKNIK